MPCPSYAKGVRGGGGWKGSGKAHLISDHWPIPHLTPGLTESQIQYVRIISSFLCTTRRWRFPCYFSSASQPQQWEHLCGWNPSLRDSTPSRKLLLAWWLRASSRLGGWSRSTTTLFSIRYSTTIRPSTTLKPNIKKTELPFLSFVLRICFHCHMFVGNNKNFHASYHI